MNGQKMRMNTSSGRTSQIAVASGRSSAIHFGASSPKTISAAVMIANAIATAMLCAVAAARWAGRKDRAGSNTEASAGSAIQPRPRLAIVIPSCVAAM
jgi:hypothetical protein